MKKLSAYMLAAGFHICCFAQTYDPNVFFPSEGLYRIPYADGTEVYVTRDHVTHEPAGRVDLNAPDNSPFTWMVVAAADGWIRAVEDSYNANLDCTGLVDSLKKNNYIWMEHPNGEWTKYTHIGQYSASINAGISVGDYVSAGTFLGYEGDVGCAAGQHLHFEVAVPTDTNTLLFTEVGGFLDEDHARNLVPRINAYNTDGFIMQYYLQGQTLVAGPTINPCEPDDVIYVEAAGYYPFIYVTENTFTSYSYMHENSTAFYQSGESITLKTDFPGFYCASGAYLHAFIAPCDTNFYRSSNPEMTDQTSAEEMLIWPNPTSAAIFISTPYMMQSATVYNSAGVPVQNVGNINNNKLQLELMELPSGNYFLKVICQDVVYTQQIVKF